MLDSRGMQQPGIDPQFVAQLEALANADNLAESLDEGVRHEVATQVISHFEIDEASMDEWKERMENALNLAMLIKDDKDYPWEGAANIRYPLITSAALQYNARAYPAIVPSTDVVKCTVHGADPQGQKARRAERVSRFMTWQLKVDSREWERGTDQLTLQLPITADAYRKLWFDPVKKKVRSQIRLPGKHIVINNNCTTLQTAPRVSDRVKLYPHQIESNVRSGRFIEFDYDTTGEDEQAPHEFIEQLCRYDLDGDGYAEPYIATVHKETQSLVRLITAWNMDSIRVRGTEIIEADHAEYLIHYQFMPSLDGGFHGTGMGILLGDISETINSTLNMILDSAHISSLGGGFIGAQNFRVKGGVHRMQPGEYKHLNFTGDDIRKGIVPMQFPGPSPVLFQVLGLMIDAGREVASVNDVMTGDAANSNMPVGTVMALIEQGHQVFTASYKRIYRALMDEFELIARLNMRHVSPEKYNRFLDEMGENGEPMMFDPQRDFDLSDMDIQPVADPNSVTSMQKMGKAQFLLELANMGYVDRGETTMRILDAAAIEAPEALMPKQDPRMEALAAAQEELMVLEIKQKDADLEKTIAETMAELADAEKTAAEADLLPMRTRIEMLKQHKELLSVRLQGIEQGRAGRMAGESGNAVSSQRSQGGR